MSSNSQTDSSERPGAIEVSFVMPCLNEAKTVGACIAAARECIVSNSLNAEIIVGDNGSTDGSQEIATAAGARVVHAMEKGYGSALRSGIGGAHGTFIVMADADESYDFGEAMPFIQRLRQGNDLVMGTRFGEGRIMPGAMPFKHKYLGNPVLSWLGRTLFKVPIRDFHCGLRAFRKESFTHWDLRTTGMEFASEMVIKAVLSGARVTQVPITLHKDGRDRPPHLRSWRDGWRHLRFMLCLSPRWTLMLPGVVLFFLGLVVTLGLSLRPVTVGHVTFDVHTMVAGAMLAIVGYQCITVAAAMRIFTLLEQLGPPSPRVERLFNVFTLERGVVLGLLLSVVGVAFIGTMFWRWAAHDFGAMNVVTTLRPVILGGLCVAIGMQTILMSFVYSMMGIKHT